LAIEALAKERAQLLLSILIKLASYKVIKKKELRRLLNNVTLLRKLSTINIDEKF